MDYIDLGRRVNIPENTRKQLTELFYQGCQILQSN